MYSCMSSLLFVVCLFSLFFFFKQKTAYEMRISDWSSDVCSSDLLSSRVLNSTSQITRLLLQWHHARHSLQVLDKVLSYPTDDDPSRQAHTHVAPLDLAVKAVKYSRSEEHTSELQSLMRISYAVFCLKKKKTQEQKT